MKRKEQWIAISCLALLLGFGSAPTFAAPGAMGLLEECRSSCAENGWTEQQYESRDACHAACLISVGVNPEAEVAKKGNRETPAGCRKSCADTQPEYRCLKNIDLNITAEMDQYARQRFMDEATESCRRDAVRKCELAQCSTASARDPKVAGGRTKPLKDASRGGGDVIRTTTADKPR